MSFIEQNSPEPKVKALNPMYGPSEVSVYYGFLANVDYLTNYSCGLSKSGIGIDSSICFKTQWSKLREWLSNDDQVAIGTCIKGEILIVNDTKLGEWRAKQNGK